MEQFNSLNCQFCGCSFNNVRTLKAHIKAHGYKLTDKGEDIWICATNNCKQKFKTSRGFFYHVDVYHCIKKSVVSVDLHQASQHAKTLENVKNDPKEKCFHDNMLLYEKHFTECIANLRMETKCTGEDLGRVVKAFESFHAAAMADMKKRAIEFLISSNVDIASEEAQRFLKEYDVQETFSGLKNLRGQIRAIKKYYKFVEPLEVLVGCQPTLEKNEKSGADEIVMKPKFMQYVSVIETLKLVLSNPEVMEYIENEDLESDDDILGRYEDGEHFKNHPFFQRFPKAIRIFLYYDDFLINNPLGSKTHQQKIGIFYVSFSNLPYDLREFLGNVHVLGIVKTKYMTKFGMNACLTPFMMDLQKLEADCGFEVMINNEPYVLRGTLEGTIADTLAAHQLFGLVSPAGNYFCRGCMLSSTERKYLPGAEASLRNKYLHNEHIKKVQEDPDDTSTTGVDERSILCDSKYYDLTQNDIFDIVHDGFEGGWQYILKAGVGYFVKVYGLDCLLLNFRIENYDYGPMESKNKPTGCFNPESLRNVATDKRLHERAAQTRCLLRVIPFLVSDIVPPNDPCLLLIIKVNQITEMIFAPEIRKSDLPYLQELIESVAEVFKHLFPDLSTINKLHHFMHYVQGILKMGPLCHLSTFKYEAQHQLFKKLGAVCCNYMNIELSL